MVADCPFPYVTLVNDPSPCSTSYAVAAGSAYTQYRIIWLIIAVPCFVLALIQNIRLWTRKGFTARLFCTNLQHQIFGVCFITSLFIMIRGIDPQGWSGRYWQADQHIYDWCTIGPYVLFTLGACSWLKIMTNISGGNVRHVEYFQRTCVGLTAGFFSLMSFLKIYAHPSWIFTVLNLIYIICLNITLIIIAWIYGYRIQQQLSRFSSSHSSAKTESTTTPPPATTTATAPSSPTTTKTTVRKPEGMTAHRRTVLTILKLLSAMSVLTVVVVTFQLLNINTYITTRYDFHDRPLDVPKFTVMSILQQSLLTLAQEAVVLISLFFYRGLPPSGNSTNSTHLSKESTQDTKQTSAASPRMIRPNTLNTTIQGQQQGPVMGPKPTLSIPRPSVEMEFHQVIPKYKSSTSTPMAIMTPNNNTYPTLVTEHPSAVNGTPYSGRTTYPTPAPPPPQSPQQQQHYIDIDMSNV